MKRLVFYILITFLFINTVLAERLLIKPTIKTKTTFAIFIDDESYKATEDKINAYRDVIENDGLATYIISDKWESPEQIKDIMVKLYNEKTPLEGVVFIGNIPIAMVRDAQYLSSAFKMDQKRDWTKSSIPSDRFYDDFDLKFNFIKSDEKIKNYFYYSLSYNSPNTIKSDVYSARIHPGGKNKMDLLGKYLDKVVRAHKENNVLDNMFVFRGHGYNSEALEAWSGEQLALQTQLPSLFMPNSKIRFYDHETAYPMKKSLLNELKRNELDVALFHHHGSYDTQYINGTENVSDINSSIDNIKRYLRSKVENVKTRDKNIKKYTEYFDVPVSWTTINDSTVNADKDYNDLMDINIKDIYAAKPNSRFVMFDACFNGSFHRDDCIANAYIFSDGKTIVTQGNSVNSLQDRFPDEFIGLFDYGIRIGQWGRHVQTYLETHIIGDPTYHFCNNANSKLNINEDLVLKSNNNKYWTKLLNNNSADLQSIALRKLCDNNYAKADELLWEMFRNSQYGVVRMEAMKLMSDRDRKKLVEMLKYAPFDNYELIRRVGINYIGKCGDNELAKVIAKAFLEEYLSKRVNYHIKSIVLLFEPAVMINALKEEYSKYVNNKYPDDSLETIINNIYNNKNKIDSYMEIILNKNEIPKSRIQEITMYRNYNYHYNVPVLINLALDSTQDKNIRVSIVEALGWFKLSYQKKIIADMCNKIISNNDNSNDLIIEAKKTLNRMIKE